MMTKTSGLSSKPTDLPVSRVSIIFVTHTVHKFLPLLNSLVQRTSLKLSIVSNGCTADEEKALMDFCAQQDDLPFKSLELSEPAPHGVVLNKLLDDTGSEFFSFMDSDIFATGPVSMDEITPTESQFGCCSCLPAWHKSSDISLPGNYQKMGGRFIKSDTGYFLGCSYLASYRTRRLKNFLNNSAISFMSADNDSLPAEIKSQLRHLGLERRFYDTTKLLHIFAQQQGEQLEYRSLPNLVHLGGVSASLLAPSRDRLGIKKRLTSLLPRTASNRIKSWRSGCAIEESENYVTLQDRRMEVSAVFNAVFNGPPYDDDTQQLINKYPFTDELETIVNDYKRSNGLL